MDQLVENLIGVVFDNEDEPKRKLVYSQFMGILEYIVNDLSKGFLELGGVDKAVSFGRLEAVLNEEFDNLQKK